MRSSHRVWTIPEWCSRTPTERHARLVEVLERDAGPVGSFDARGKRTLAVFESVQQSRHRYGAEAIGLYIVGGATHADDVLAPLVLARWAEAYDKNSGQVALDVAPLFESGRDPGALAGRACASCSRTRSTNVTWSRADGCRRC